MGAVDDAKFNVVIEVLSKLHFAVSSNTCDVMNLKLKESGKQHIQPGERETYQS